MKQVLIKGGKVFLETVPTPQRSAGMALVQVHYSLISTGTESAILSNGGIAGQLMKKARNPLNVEKVKRKLATVGMKGTLEVVRDKLLAYQVPGYSTAGVIAACGPDVPGFRVGDRVACAGVGYAAHAEYNAVPHQLITPLPDRVDFRAGAFVALGAIAMQGLRRIQPTFGENIVVIGLGLVGLLTLQIARAAGCHVVGTDPIAARRKLAIQLGADIVCTPEALDGVVHEQSGGHGADGVVVCAASKRSAISNQAIALCRHRGRVSVIGTVGLHLERGDLYQNEVDFSVSCSYGPGRYQANYEEKGLDYPIGFVRWTEGRNMAEFLRMVADGRVAVAPLVSVERPLEDAASAYGALQGEKCDTIAALLRYGSPNEAISPPEATLTLRASTHAARSQGIAVIGAGNYARAIVLPNLASIPGCHLEAIVSRTGPAAKQVAERYGARLCSTDLDAVLADSAIKSVIIATRHHLHYEQVLAALDGGKHVFVEKPLALTVEACTAICSRVEETGLLLSVGFNRRFSPYAQAAKRAVARMSGPKHVLYRCNAGRLPAGHWTLDPDEGGGRILGEAVHFFDFCCWLLGGDPVAIQAEATGLEVDPDSLTTVLRYGDGSVAAIHYVTTGNSAAGKEFIEIHGGGGTIRIDDFRCIAFYGVAGTSTRKGKEDKGHKGCLTEFIHASSGRCTLSITAQDGLRATRIAIDALTASKCPTQELRS